MEKVKKYLDTLRAANLFPDIRQVDSAAAPEVFIGGRKILMFCSNNYLGLVTDENVVKETYAGVEKYGLGSGGSRLLSGNSGAHRELEKKIADFKGCEDAIVYTTGYQANAGTITSVMDGVYVSVPGFLRKLRKKDVIMSDKLNHASIIDGCRLCRQKTVIYRHRDMKHLRSLLRKYKRRRKIIVTDAVFSMDGDITPLPDILELAERYDSMVMVDEAHSTGVLGRSGRGITEHFHLDGKVDIIMGTLSKALGGLGGYVAGTRELVEYLRVTARSYIFSTAFPPAIALGVIAAIEKIQNEPELIQRLWKNVEQLKNGLQARGFDTLGSETQIIPVLIGDEMKAIRAARFLYEKGIFAPCVRWPAVSRGRSRIRLTVMATHTEEQIERLVNTFTEMGKSLDLIN